MSASPLVGIRAELQAQLASLGPPSDHRSFTVADVDLEVRVYGSELAQAMLPAFDGRTPSAPGASPMVVHIWDHQATNTSLPANIQVLLQPGQHPRYVDGTNHLFVSEGVCGLITEGDAQPTALAAVDAAASLPSLHRGSPASLLLASLTGRRGRPFVHAACVGLPQHGGLLIAGRSGSGKSTTALRCLAAGWQYVGDDYVVVRPGDATAHCLYSTAKLAPSGFADDRALVPRNSTLYPDPRHCDKTIAQLWPGCSAHMPPSLPIRAIVAPVVGTGRRTTWERAAPGRGLLALAPSTLIQLPTASSSQLGPLSRLARSVPAVTMELGSDPDGVVAALADVLNSVGREP